METRFEQTRVTQLTSRYTPNDPPRIALDMGDLLSILWRLDQSMSAPSRERYYRRCALALCRGLRLEGHPLYRFIESTPVGDICRLLPSLIYRVKGRTVDAHDRKLAIDQMLRLRSDIMRIGTYQDSWINNWPGSGMQDVELRERVFAVLFTALQGQFGNFGRLLLVIDIVIANVLVGLELPEEIPLTRLVTEFAYPDPSEAQSREAFADV